jgi:hypothetical protein
VNNVAPDADEANSSRPHRKLFADVLAENSAQAPIAAPVTADPFWRLWSLGYRGLVPIVPPGAPVSDRSSMKRSIDGGHDSRGKAPGIKNADGKWMGFATWTTHDPTEADLKSWSVSGAGVGLKTGDLGDGLSLVAIDADTLDDDRAKLIENAIIRRFGSLPKRVGLAPKAAYPIRVRGAFTYARIEFGAPTERVEILSDRRQFVAHGVHPKTMQPYRWDRPLIALDELPIVDGSELIALLEELQQHLPAATPIVQEGAGPAVDQAALKGDPDLVVRAVRATPNTTANFPTREAFRDFGYAIKGALQDDPALALETFLDWAERWEDPEGAVNDLEYVRAEWSRMKPPFRVGASKLYSMAEEMSGGAFIRAEDWFEEIAPSAPSSSQANQPTARFGFATAARLLASDLISIPDREFVLGSRFQPGTLTLGAGPAGVSKSTFVLLSGLAIATGRALTGELVSRQGRVLIYNAEDPRSEMLRRLLAIAGFYGISHDVVLDRIRLISGYDDRRLVFAERKERGGLIRPGADVADLTDYVIADGIVHVALDPLVSLHRGLEENSAADMEALGDQLRRFAQRSGASVDLIHHTVKSRAGQGDQNAGNADAARGSGAVMGFVRSAYSLTPMGDTTATSIGLPKEKSAQLVRLDDSKRNYARRSAREAWFEIRSVLTTGEEIGSQDFEATDPAVRKRALSSVGVHVRFDINKQRALSAMSRATDAEARLETLRTFLVGTMQSDAASRTALTSELQRSFDFSSTTARTKIDEACPEGRAHAVSVEADGMIYDFWREMRREGRTDKWFLVRQSKGPAISATDKMSADLVALEGVFG